MTSKTAERLEQKEFVYAVDDERHYGNGYIVTLEDTWFFMDDPGCGVRGFDTLREVAETVRRSNVYREKT